jgi:hypothetical protein
MILRGLNSGHRTARLALTVMAFSAVAFVARAQTPQAFFERSTVTGSGNTISATNVPVVISPGLTVYINVTMQFNVDHNGNLTLSSGYPQVVPAPNLLSSTFQAGTYVGPSSAGNPGTAVVTVSGPGVTDGGATEWSLNLTTDVSDTNTCNRPNPRSATWYVGPTASNPVAARLKSAGITSTAWSYGVASASQCLSCTWSSGALIGASQTGNAITIASFSTGCGFQDKSAPTDQITYTLKP